MVPVYLNLIKRLIYLILVIIYIHFCPHISCVSTSTKEKSKEQNKLSSKYMPYTQPYYPQAYFNQQNNYNTPAYYRNFDTKNLTIEVLPNDDDEDDDGYLKFGLLRDAYGYGDSIRLTHWKCFKVKSPKMAFDSTLYNCNYTTNIYTKSKKWNTGLLRARSNHGSVTLYLYELDEQSNSRGKLIDTYDIFNAKPNTLTGREFITGRNLIDVQGKFGEKYYKPVEVPVTKPKIRTGLQRYSKPAISPYSKENAPNSNKSLTNEPAYKPKFENKPTTLFKSENNLPTANMNVNDIIKNIELMLDEN